MSNAAERFYELGRLCKAIPALGKHTVKISDPLAGAREVGWLAVASSTCTFPATEFKENGAIVPLPRLSSDENNTSDLYSITVCT